MNERILNKVLRLICADYELNKKTNSATLKSYEFDSFIFSNNEFAKLLDDNDLLTEIDVVLNVLEANDFITSSFEVFHLTELGYEVGTTNVIKRTIKWLNSNPGIALIISVLSLIVSILALYFSANLAAL
ncbi:hypothetical protein GNP79_19270 [Aliivibrio fischeri]|uniref:Uncharacterized protein n=2 Tax=Aliivibrio fischeri TaxID=668 RepID=A0A6N3YYW6_ALIFS|nr:hypothetical protein [Aliivibrio fischeri]MUK45868.1 hypothetical protein [Aliivibrio fischeri]MUK82925.1 hypothetical protein [Aliivibrio fischeri]MUK86734.1 hypothetical protein [Aliivibrio fischeri]